MNSISAKIPVLFITYNRLEYSKKALAALMNTHHPITIYFWDNGSTDGTVEWLNMMFRNLEPGLKAPEGSILRLLHENEGINSAFNEFIKEFEDCQFMAKVDNDTIVDPLWLDKLKAVMELRRNLDVCGAFMQRPPGQWDFQTWVDSVMEKDDVYEYGNDYLAYNSYTGGTGVLMRTAIFREQGLLFDKYPCKLGDFTTFQRLIFKGRNIAWYSGTVVKLLNIKVDGKELSDDYPEYDEELKKVRDKGNAWYTSVGGAPGVAKFIEQNGGRERL